MNLEEIRTEVELKVEDPSYGPDQLNEFINSCVFYAAALVSIPSLKRIGTVVTQEGYAWVSLASELTGNGTFSGHLKKVKKSDGVFPTVYPDLDRLMLDYDLDEEGEVLAVALEGNTLWYAKMPETTQETLTLLYYVNPSRLIANSNIPSDFPEHVHRKLFVHGTAYMVWDEIENRSELEGQKVKTTEHYWQAFDDRNADSGLNLLRRWLARVKSHHISSVWNY